MRKLSGKSGSGGQRQLQATASAGPKRQRRPTLHRQKFPLAPTWTCRFGHRKFPGTAGQSLSGPFLLPPVYYRPETSPVRIIKLRRLDSSDVSTAATRAQASGQRPAVGSVRGRSFSAQDLLSWLNYPCTQKIYCTILPGLCKEHRADVFIWEDLFLFYSKIEQQIFQIDNTENSVPGDSHILFSMGFKKSSFVVHLI